MASSPIRSSARIAQPHWIRFAAYPKWPACLLVFWLCSLLLPGTATACRYNVRDIGFIELDVRTYSLFCYVGDETPANGTAGLAETARHALGDCNIQFEVIHTAKQKDHPALAHLPGPTGQLPTAMLVSPDDQVRPLTIPLAGQPLADALSAALREITSSPKREEIVASVRQVYAAVLLIEGETVDENNRARTTIARAIEQIQAQMKWLPKAIAEPPALIALDAASLAREKVLLWSLGLDTAPASQPRAMVLYGKARRIGSVMTGEQITVKKLTEILSIIGADCECGLDISWTQGTRLPVQWGDRLHAQVTKALGFDPENPLVKIEASNIMGKRGTGKTVSIGYQEFSLDGPGDLAEENPSERQVTNQVAAALPPDGGTPLTPLLAQTQPPWKKSLWAIGGLTSLVLAIGLFIVLRAAKRKQFE